MCAFIQSLFLQKALPGIYYSFHSDKIDGRPAPFPQQPVELTDIIENAGEQTDNSPRNNE